MTFATARPRALDPRMRSLQLRDGRFEWLRRRWRMATGNLRSLPDFIIAGAMKSGTTSLFYYLMQHPQIMASTVKQVRYFDGGPEPTHDNFARGPCWYRSHFPFVSTLKRSGSITGEASPMTMFHPDAAMRVWKTVPGVKLIFILRNPVDRAISHYRHAVRHGEEDLPIDQAFSSEPDRLRAEDRRDRAYSFVHHSYVSRGMYAEQIARFLQLFPREQALIVPFEQMEADVHGLLSRVCAFLSIDDCSHMIDTTARNRGGRMQTECPGRLYSHLREQFGEPNAALFSLIDEKFPWQDSPGQ